jgi:hypothetical protein
MVGRGHYSLNELESIKPEPEVDFRTENVAGRI